MSESRALASSRRYCARVTRRANSSFPIAFRLLPRPKREAMTALYAYYRLTDDLADDPGPADVKRRQLTEWRRRLDGRDSHRVHAALRVARRDYGIPQVALSGVIDGSERDLEGRPFATPEELDAYCDQVAGTVGVASVCVWGFRSPSDRDAALTLAMTAGRAFQLTNILRDVGEDLRNGRVYLPLSECERFGCPPDGWRNPDAAGRFAELFASEVDRARAYYREAEKLPRLLGPDGQAIWRAMSGLYRRLLERVAARGPDLDRPRVRLTKREKLAVMAAALPARWGW